MKQKLSNRIKNYFFYQVLMLLTFSVFSPLVLQAQKAPEPTWKYTLSKSEAKVGETIELIFKTDVPKDWYIYSNDFDPDLGPQVPTFTFEKHSSYELIGKPKPEGNIRKYDDTWEGEVSIFKKHATFRQKVKVLSKDFTVKGILDYQMCSDVTGMCVIFSPDFEFKGLKVSSAAESVNPKTEKSTVPESVPDASTPENTPETSAIDTPEASRPEAVPAVSDNKEVSPEAPKETVKESGDDDIRNKSLLTLFLIGFGAGFLAILTPCVFPMLPMTVAFFTKQDNKAKGRSMAVFYGLSIVGIYVTFGLLLSSLFGATFGYTISTHWFPNMLFFLIFMIFGISFLGAFEIVLPSSLVNKIDQKGDKGGYIGVFFIALTLVVISFSCTVPIVGSVAILAEDGEIIKPLAAMLGFAISFAMPFTLFAFFPQWLQSLPKSGGWLNSVKVFFGFVEIALALKFFSQADLAYHWGILDRDVFIAFWVVLSVLLGLYFFGKLRFSHDSPMDHIPVPRFLLGLVAITFGIYLLPGMWGAPLKPLAGILPPLTTQDYVSTGNGQTVNIDHSGEDTVRHADILHLPHGLKGFYDFKQGLQAIKATGKPGFLDFTGHSCANCRKMEENVWPDPGVIKRLREDVVIISLYTDEKRELPEDEWYTSERDGRVKKTVGQQNLDMEVSRYGENAQPMYFIVNENGDVLTKFNGYKNDPEAYIKFIDEGVAEFKKQKK